MNADKNEVTADPFYLVKKMTLVNEFAAAFSLVENEVHKLQAPVIVSFINAHAYNLLYKDDQFYEALSYSDFIFRDGKGMELLFRSIGIDAGKNLCGTDFIPFMLSGFRNRTMIILGTSNEILITAMNEMKKEGLNVVASANGFLPADEYLNIVKSTQPFIILLGMGMPKQEIVAAYLKKHISFPCVIINGGAIVDHYGKKVKRAPKWLREIGGEWLFRLLTEPRRLFKRYVFGNWIFLRHIKSIKKRNQAIEFYQAPINK